MLDLQPAKEAVLHTARLCGLFTASRRLTADGLCILCYHGISTGDEHAFRPKLFMRSETFAHRMDWLAANGYRAIGLGDAIRRLQAGEALRRTLVLTFDDGWQSCLDGAFAKLAQLGWPATLYVTTYYSTKQHPVFNVAVDYLLWRAGQQMLELSALDKRLRGRFDLGRPDGRASARSQIVPLGEGQLDADERRCLLYRLARNLGDDPTELFEHRGSMRLMDRAGLDRASAMGIDIQLHTHRHRFPMDDADAIWRELQDNRAVLESSATAELQHFCYPSGVYHPSSFQTLRDAGIRTATTTDPGFNFPGSEPLALSRFCDGENVSAIEFEGELSGFNELRRQIRSGVPPWARHSPLRWRGAED